MNKLTLSFDNGPTPGITDHVLDALKAYGVRATFFVVGTRLQSQEGWRLAERARSEGHWIGSHSMTHGEPLGNRADPHAVQLEIGNMFALMGELNHEDRLFRPNGRGKMGPHLLSKAARDYLILEKATVVLWTHVPNDRGGAADAWVQDAQRASQEIEWPLLVLHDRPSGHDAPAGSMTHLDQYLEWALRSNISFSQQFPANCVPIRRGQISLPLEPYMPPADIPSAPPGAH